MCTASPFFCFDLDGTVTRQEILPIIASEVGLKEEIDLLTSLTMRGLVPFESSFRLRCRLLREVPISRVREIVSSIRLDPEIEAFIRDNRDSCAIVTGNLDVWVAGLLERLGCEAFTSLGIVTGDRLDGVSRILCKSDPVRELRARGFVHVVAVGDGFNDIPMLEEADIGIAFAGVHSPVPQLIQLADYIANGATDLCQLLRQLQQPNFSGSSTQSLHFVQNPYRKAEDA
jgi:HAD superfamily phosphoserine phosphatase-like hydrolase